MATSSSWFCFASTQASWWHHVSSRTPSPVLRPNPVNRLPMVLRPKPPNSSGEMYPLSLLHDLDVYHRPSLTTRSPSSLMPPLDLLNRHLDLVNKVYSLHMYTCLLMSLGLSHPWLVSQSLVPRSKPFICPSLLLVHRHGTTLADLLHSHWPHLCSTPVHHKPRNVLHKHHIHAMVSLRTQPKLDHLLTITHH
jgi:hypothetical protein